MTNNLFKNMESVAPFRAKLWWLGVMIQCGLIFLDHGYIFVSIISIIILLNFKKISKDIIILRWYVINVMVVMSFFLLAKYNGQSEHGITNIELFTVAMFVVFSMSSFVWLAKYLLRKESN